MVLTLQMDEAVGVLRRRHGLSQEQLGASVGVERWQIAYLETGRNHKLNDVQLQKIAIALGTTLKQLRETP